MSDQSFYIIKRMVRENIAPYKKRVIIAIFCMIIAAGATSGNAWIMQPMLDKIFLEKDSSMLILIPFAVFGLAITNGLANYTQSVQMKFVGQRIVTDMQQRLFGHLIYSDIRYISQFASGKLISKFSNDINLLRRGFANVLTGLTKEILTLIFLVALMFYQNTLLAVIAFTVFPLAFYPIVRLGKKMRKISSNTQKELEEFTAHLDDIFQSIRLVKSYRREEFEIARAKTIMERIFNLYMKAARNESISSPIMETLGGISVALVIWYGGSQVLAGETTPGSFFSFITALLIAYRPLKSISNLNSALQEGLASAKRLYDILDHHPSIINPNDAKILPIGNKSIIFQNVSFSYYGEKNALNNINFVANPGEKIAFVGNSGGGKSTIMALIQRFYDVNNGNIMIDNLDIRDISLESLRDNIAIVNQEIMLFDDTIMNNIRYGRLDASNDEIIAAAKSAAADEFIKLLPDGYNSMIGQHGMKLSGGQRQRISIARAILKNAPILLLDEATSALDTISENLIEQAFARLMKGKTTLIIAHRLSTIINSDKICVIDNGEIKEVGTHLELLAKGGIYTYLYETQFANHLTTRNL